jgi:hypothetical protein
MSTIATGMFELEVRLFLPEGFEVRKESPGDRVQLECRATVWKRS